MVSDQGLTTYDNKNETHTVPLIYEDGSVQLNTVIESPTAPERYDYKIDLPDGAKMFTEGEFVKITSNDGILLGLITPAWAQDANGQDVSTWYEVRENHLTQVVKHSNTNTYPVVADPYLGINLFGHVYTDSYNGQPRVNASLSAFGWTTYASGANGQRILNTYGLAEVLSRGADVRSAMNKTSMYQQFQCHALGALAAGQWNLEKFRVNRTTHWSYGVAVHRCNWNTANRY